MIQETGIPIGMITGLAAQALLAGGPLPLVWWIGATLLVIMSIIVMSFFIAMRYKKAEEEWMMVVWSRPAEIMVVDDFAIDIYSRDSPVIPGQTLLTYNKEMDQYECFRNAEGVTYAISPTEIMHNPEYFDLPC